jgi:hypothetical protein
MKLDINNQNTTKSIQAHEAEQPLWAARSMGHQGNKGGYQKVPGL